MSKINQLIQLKDLANAYSNIIDNYFNIKVNVETELDPLKSSGIMFATRQPYKISNIKAESLQIAMRFYCCCESEEAYNDTIKILSQLVGLCKGTFNSNDKTYRYYSFLDFARPLSDPEINSGKFFQTLELMGTCLVTQTLGGVLIANETSTTLTFNADTETEIEGSIEVLASTTALVKAQESPQMANAVVGKAINLSQTFSYSYTILILKNAICERIIKALENILPIGVNEGIQITETYPPFEGVDNIVSSKLVTLTGGQINKNAGTFVTAQLTFQDKLEIASISDNQGSSSEVGGGTSPSPTPTLNCVVTIGSGVSITNIVGAYEFNQNGTISCELGTIISVSIDGINRNITYSGVIATRTSAPNIVSPKTYDVNITAVIATIGTVLNGGGNIVLL